jgi:hypothetical protein
VAPIKVVSTNTIAKLLVSAGAPVHVSGGICDAVEVVSQVALVGNAEPSGSFVLDN